jgi:GNAT superfamily N-acetyltransferase
MTIRKANINDIIKLAKIFDEYRMFYNMKSDYSGAKLFLEERIKLNESTIFIAEDNENRILGFIQLYPIFSSTRMKKLWLLNDLFVDKDYRGKGISISLINQAKNLCTESNACGLILETEKSNLIGNNLYVKTGFSLDTEHHFYSWNVDK